MSAHGEKLNNPLVLSGERPVRTEALLNKNGSFAKQGRRHQTPYEVTINGEKSLVLLNLVINQNLLHFWIAFCGPKNQADKFNYTMKIVRWTDMKSKKISFLFMGARPCVPCDIPWMEILAERSCLMVNEKLIQQASDKENGDIYYTFKIEKV